jgi:hypothetical protein
MLARIRQVIAAAAGDEDPLLPELEQHLRRHRASNLAPAKSACISATRADAEPSSSPKTRTWKVVEVLHRAGGVERGRDHAQAAEHPLGAEAPGQRVEMAEAVQQRQDRRLRADRRRERFHRLGQVVGLAGDDDDVEGRVQVFLEHERRRGQGRIAEAALDHEAGASQGLGPAGAQQEGDVASRPRAAGRRNSRRGPPPPRSDNACPAPLPSQASKCSDIRAAAQRGGRRS